MTLARALVLALSALALPCAAVPPAPGAVDNFRLLDHRGASHELYRYSYAKAIVVVSHGLGCAIVKDNLPGLKALRDEFAPKGAAFLLLNSNPQDSREDLAAHAASLGVDIPVLKDETQAAMRALGIERTAEALILDGKTRTVVYRGPISDQFGYGIRKPRPDADSLRDALAAFLAGKPVPAPRSDVAGCLITRRPAKRLTYVKDAAPILARRCVVCHDGRHGMAWSMRDYKQVQGWSAMTREVLMTQRMPPWHADSAHGKFKNDLSLPAEERATLLDWIEAGAERGDGKDPLAARPAPAAASWPDGEPDMILKLPKPQSIPADGDNILRMIPLAGPLEKDLVLSNIVVRPGNRAVVHHIHVYLTKKPIVEHDGFPDFPESDSVSIWAPGLEMRPLPKGVASVLPAGRHINLQIHYTPLGKPEMDETEVGLYFYRGPKKPIPLKHISTDNMEIVIPAGERDYRAKTRFHFENEAWITGIMPHMHYRGKSMRFVARYPDETTETLLSVPNYDFNWQRYYQFTEPRKIPAGTLIEVDGAFDNSMQNPANPDPRKTVNWGWDAPDEMFYSVIYYFERPSD